METPSSASNPATMAVPADDWHGDRRWMSIHERYLDEVKLSTPKVVLIGDSLIQQIPNAPVWKEWFEPLGCLNLGLGGDQTQHVLWRVENGELDFAVANASSPSSSSLPRVVVVCVGTNNHGHSADQVADGILAVVAAVRRKLPAACVVVVAVPPRGRHMNNLREKIADINRLVQQRLLPSESAQYDPFVTFVGATFMHDLVETAHGGGATISHHDMFDYLHFTNDGYRKFCRPIIDEIKRLLDAIDGPTSN